MDYSQLVRSSASLWLSVVDLYCEPLRALTAPPPLSAEEERAGQEEVWEMWGRQAPPLQFVIFE